MQWGMTQIHVTVTNTIHLTLVKFLYDYMKWVVVTSVFKQLLVCLYNYEIYFLIIKYFYLIEYMVYFVILHSVSY